jgi:hypothetical protein
MFIIGSKDIQDAVTPVAGLTDWYPRGQKIVVTPIPVANETISLACNNSGAITIAIKMSVAEANANSILKMKLIQTRVENVSSQTFLYKIITSTVLITGKDSTGKILRFNQLAIDEGRVFVRVDGVLRNMGASSTEYSLTPNSINFNTALNIGSIVDVAVYSEKGTIDRVLTFTQHDANIDNNYGAWGNIRYLEEYNSSMNLSIDKWWIYTCSEINSINYSSSIRLDGIFEIDETTPFRIDDALNSVRFLISAPAHENTDRYLNFYIDCIDLHNEFLITSVFENINTLYADGKSLRELFPTFQIIDNLVPSLSAYLKADVFIPSTSQIQTDSPAILLSGNKTIGPI